MSRLWAARPAERRKIVFVNRFFFPDHSATSQILTDLTFALAAAGKRIVVVTSRLKYDDANVVLAARELAHGVEIHRVWTSRFGRHHLGGRAIDYVTFYFSSVWKVWRLSRAGDVVVVKTDPPLLSIFLQPVARLRRAKVINWLQDVFPEVAQTLGVGKGPLVNTGYRTLTWLRDQTLRWAACNVVLGQRMALKISSLGVHESRIKIIPNWADGNLVRPIDHSDNALRRQWAEANDFVVGYSGNLGRAHEYETLIDAMSLLEKSEEMVSPTRIKWLFIGGGALFDAFKKEVTGRGLRAVLFLPYQPRNRLAESLSASDVHLVSLRPELEGLIVPSKFYGIAAAGRVSIFIGAKDGEIARVLRDRDCGVTITPGDGEGLAEQIRGLASDAARVHAMGVNARRLFEEKFDKTIAVNAWSQLIEFQMKD